MYNTGIFVKKSIPSRYGYQRLPPLIPPLGINGGGGEAASSLYKRSEVSL